LRIDGVTEQILAPAPRKNLAMPASTWFYEVAYEIGGARTALGIAGRSNDSARWNRDSRPSWRFGRGADLVAELEQPTGEHPLRERLLAALMLALYRAGRQTDALEVFHAARHRLIDELGLEPGPGLHELRQRILRHDPTLGPPRRFPSLSAPRGRRTFALAGGVAVLLAVAAVVAGGFGASAGATRVRRIPALPAGTSGIIAVDARSGRVVTATSGRRPIVFEDGVADCV
jgi:hypothetical protein